MIDTNSNNREREEIYKMEELDAIALVKEGASAWFYVDSKGKDYDGLSLIAKSFAKDVNTITGITPTITSDINQLKNTVLVAGSIGNNVLIDTLIAESRIDVSAIINKWECYQIKVIDHPTEKIDRAVIIVGSDKRGTIYGIYHISELIGVSPWVYWGDVVPVKQQELIIPVAKLEKIAREPSVKYRGIFLNDEWPSLGTWCTNKFGGFNEDLYVNVFELILRLKGNYLWPAMWSAIFSENGKSSNIANAKLADAYGIVMGTSHHEGLYRAGEEWQKDYLNYGKSNEWNFAVNREAITKFWEDAVIRNKDFENLITLGMRGERDSALGGSLQDNINLLKDIITTQKALLKKYGNADAPQILTLYKEVEKFWYGTEEVTGLKDWEVLNDVTIMLAEDNFGNLRTLPAKEERNRKAGWGMYYHFDYHGGPVSYEWINTSPIEKTWEQMSMAYDYGVREVWIVNVGDLKPAEFNMSYFLDLAYDFDTWGTKGKNKTKEYTLKWVQQQFGKAVGMDGDIIKGIAKVISDYARMNGNRKPEVLTPTIYSNIYEKEAQTMLEQAISLEMDAKKYEAMMPASLKDAYYQLVYYPAVASANVVKMHIYAGLNHRYYALKSVLANQYAKLVEEAITTDEGMQKYYNDTLSSGKWQGIMSSPHIGYVNWNADGWKYPEYYIVDPLSEACMIVDIEGVEPGYRSGTAKLPVFTNLLQENYAITISNGGKAEFEFTAEASEDWIRLDNNKGLVVDGKSINVTVNWDKVLTTSNGMITITGAKQTVHIEVTAEVVDVSSLPEKTFVGKNNIISIEAEHTVDKKAKEEAEWKVIENYGRTLSSLKMYPTTVSFQNVQAAPYLEYSIYVAEDTNYILTLYTAPSNNLLKGSRLKYAVSFDGEEPDIADSLHKNFIAGDYNNEEWCNGVLDNIHTSTTSHRLITGTHLLRIYGLDAGLVIQKLVLSKDKLPDTYLGPKESYCKI